MLSVSQQSFAQNTTTSLTIPDDYLSEDFKGTGNFNAIIFGNFQSNSGDVEGRLAVAGNMTLNTSGYSVGTAAVGTNAPDLTDNLIVNGQFINNGGGNWGLRGNMVYNTAPAGTTFPSLIVPGTSITGAKPDYIRFSDNKLIDYYRTLSRKLGTYASTGTVTFDGYHQYTLKGNSNGLNIFNITLPNTTSSDEIKVEIPGGSSALINVLNETLSITGGSMRMNGADAANVGVVFNFPNASSISLANYKFLGSFLAPKASLSGYGGSINGQAIIGGDFEQQGGFEFHNFYFYENTGTLPVTLVKFAAAREGSAVNLSWTTTAETNSSHFDIEHSVNGKSWSRVGTVASHGESSQLIHYTFTDPSPAYGANLYRLKMTDLDGTFAYSSIQSVNVEAGAVVSVFPNPASDRILVYHDTDVTLVTITDLSGRDVYRTQQVTTAGIDCKNLSSGMYVVRVARANGTVESQKIVIRK